MSGTPGKSGGRRGPRLTERERRFAHEYLIDGNAAKAAIRAGYATSCSKNQGYDLLQRAPIADLVAKLQARIDERTMISAERIQRELAVVAFSTHAHYGVDGDSGTLGLAGDAPPDAERALASVKHRTRTERRKDGEEVVTHEVEYKLWDKVRALELLAKITGALKDQPTNVNVTINLDQLREQLTSRIARLATANREAGRN